MRKSYTKAFVALNLGPTGKLLAPYGDLPFEEAVDIYGEMVRSGARHGADLILIETNCIGILLRKYSKSFCFDQALGLLVPVSYMHCCTSTPGLSTL